MLKVATLILDKFDFLEDEAINEKLLFHICDLLSI